MQNQNTTTANGTHNNNAEINHNNHLHHTTTTNNGQVQDNFNHALPPPPPYTNNNGSAVVNNGSVNGKTSAKINGSAKPLKVTTIQVKDVEKNGFELSRKDQKGFTTDAGGGGALAMGGSAHGIQVNHRTS